MVHLKRNMSELSDMESQLSRYEQELKSAEQDTEVRTVKQQKRAQRLESL